MTVLKCVYFKLILNVYNWSRYLKTILTTETKALLCGKKNPFIFHALFTPISLFHIYLLHKLSLINTHTLQFHTTVEEVGTRYLLLILLLRRRIFKSSGQTDQTNVCDTQLTFCDEKVMSLFFCALYWNELTFCKSALKLLHRGIVLRNINLTRRATNRLN